MKRQLKIIIIILITILSNKVYAIEQKDDVSVDDTYITDNNAISSITPSEDSNYSSYDYVIDKYDIDIVVNENNTFDITENITAYFNVQKHGIYRTIPLKNTITRLDGTESTNKAQVSNVSVDNEYTTSKEDNNYKIQIGSANKTLTGEQTYTIKYTYNLGKDSSKDYDELYYNIIGTEWDTVIGNITFKITMPKSFDNSKLGFSSGSIGSTDSSNIEYQIDGNTITGSYNGILDEGQALTVRCELEEGYFVGAGLKLTFFDYLKNLFYVTVLILPLIFLGISIYLWYKYGRDDKPVEPLEFYPPEGFNSLEIGWLYKGYADSKDAISLLIYLASKGYIKIKEIGKKEFEIIKLKDYDGDNVYEEYFLQDLFEHYYVKKIDGYLMVNSKHLYHSFYKTIDEILFSINKSNDELIENSSIKKKKYIYIMLTIAIFCLNVPFNIIWAIGITVCFLFNFLIMILPADNYVSVASKDKCLIFLSSVITLATIIASFQCFYETGVSIFYYMWCIIASICIIGILLCLKYFSKRTSYGNEMYGKIKGFKNFLETAEKDKLEALVNKNPSYFYDILPYTYVLGVSDKWIKKFAIISVSEPNWYEGSTGFDAKTFMNNTMKFANNTMASRPSSSSSSSSFSGGSSGGGSSGGGSGGGGGGSW